VVVKSCAAQAFACGPITPVIHDRTISSYHCLRDVMMSRGRRHICVTLLLDAGVPPHIVQAIAGSCREEQRQALLGLAQRLGWAALLSSTAVNIALMDVALALAGAHALVCAVRPAGIEPATKCLEGTCSIR
jgi:hypothetical protein